MNISFLNHNITLQRFVQFGHAVPDVLYKMCECAKHGFAFLAAAYTSASSLPLLRSFMEACGKKIYMISIVLDGINSRKELKEKIRDLQKNYKKLDRWIKRGELIGELKDGLSPESFQHADREKQGTLTFQQQERQIVLMKACQKVSRKHVVPFKNALKAYINVKNKKLKMKIHDLKAECVKCRLSIAYSVSVTIVNIAIIAASVGLAVGGVSSLSLFFMAFLSACIVLAKKTHKAFHKNVKKDLQLEGLQLDVVNQYTLLKHRRIWAHI